MSNYFFSIRRSTPSNYDQATLSYLVGSLYTTKQRQYNTRTYINTLLNLESKIASAVDKKVDNTTLNETILNTINSGQIQTAINNGLTQLDNHSNNAVVNITAVTNTTLAQLNALSEAISQTIQSALVSMGDHQLTLLESITQSTLSSISNINLNANAANDAISNTAQTALSTINTQQQDIITNITDHTYNAMQGSITVLNNKQDEIINYLETALQSAASTSITQVQNAAGEVVLKISNDLLVKIDYIFHMFYRADSKTIMDNHPLNPDNYNI